MPHVEQFWKSGFFCCSKSAFKRTDINKSPSENLIFDSRHSEDNSNSGPKNLYEICIKKVFLMIRHKECKRFFAPVFAVAGMSSYDLPLPQL